MGDSCRDVEEVCVSGLLKDKIERIFNIYYVFTFLLKLKRYSFVDNSFGWFLMEKFSTFEFRITTLFSGPFQYVENNQK